MNKGLAVSTGFSVILISIVVVIGGVLAYNSFSIGDRSGQDTIDVINKSDSIFDDVEIEPPKMPNRVGWTATAHGVINGSALRINCEEEYCYTSYFGEEKGVATKTRKSDGGNAYGAFLSSHPRPYPGDESEDWDEVVYDIHCEDDKCITLNGIVGDSLYLGKFYSSNGSIIWGSEGNSLHLIDMIANNVFAASMFCKNKECFITAGIEDGDNYRDSYLIYVDTEDGTKEVSKYSHGDENTVFRDIHCYNDYCYISSTVKTGNNCHGCGYPTMKFDTFMFKFKKDDIKDGSANPEDHIRICESNGEELPRCNDGGWTDDTRSITYNMHCYGKTCHLPIGNYKQVDWSWGSGDYIHEPWIVTIEDSGGLGKAEPTIGLGQYAVQLEDVGSWSIPYVIDSPIYSVFCNTEEGCFANIWDGYIYKIPMEEDSGGDVTIKTDKIETINIASAQFPFDIDCDEEMCYISWGEGFVSSIEKDF